MMQVHTKSPTLPSGSLRVTIALTPRRIANPAIACRRSRSAPNMKAMVIPSRKTVKSHGTRWSSTKVLAVTATAATTGAPNGKRRRKSSGTKNANVTATSNQSGPFGASGSSRFVTATAMLTPRPTTISASNQ